MEGFSKGNGGTAWVTVYNCDVIGAVFRARMDFKLELNVVRWFPRPILLGYVKAIQLMPWVGFVIVFKPKRRMVSFYPVHAGTDSVV